MMPVNEENKELRDLVAETLKAKGVLGKVQAEIRASVFLALEEQDVFNDKSPFLNKPLKDFCKTQEGLKVLSLVREFLEFFNLEFTAMVFDPETHAGIDYTYEGRNKLASDLKVDSPSAKLPLLAHIVAQTKHVCSSITNGPNGDGKRNMDSHKASQSNSQSLQESLLNGMNGNSDAHGTSKKEIRINSENKADHLKNGNNRAENTREKARSSDPNSLASLSNLPPLNAKATAFTNQKKSELKTLIDRGLSANVDNSLSGTDSHSQSRCKENSDCEDSEIEEEIPSHNSNASGVTAVSIKKFPAKGENKLATIEASVSEELLKLKALSLSFVKDIPLRLVGQLTQSLSDKSYSEVSACKKELELSSDCETMSDVQDIEDETSFGLELKPSITSSSQ